MLGKNDLLQVLLQEIEICKHLYTKLPPGALNYRPTPNQRSTLELLQYLSINLAGPFKGMLTSDWAGVHAAADKAKQMPASEFPAAMDRQAAELRQLFDSISEAEFASKQVSLPWGATLSLQVAVLTTLMRWAPAYKMQLFLYAKAAGATDLKTPNLWRGVDAPMPAMPPPKK